MKNSLLLLFLFCSFFSVAQHNIEAIIKDALSKEPLGFCNVMMKGNNSGTISNADGIFRMSVNHDDTLIFSYLGYKTKSKAAGNLLKSPLILLERTDIVLDEVEVHADNSFLYDIVAKCRKKSIKNKLQYISKVYFGLETESTIVSVEYPKRDSVLAIQDDQALKPKFVEQLECFYNAHMDGNHVSKLQFKNGRTALAADENYFLSLNTSKAVCLIDLLKQQEFTPSIPLQFGRRNLEKRFHITLIAFDGNIYHFKFLPKKENNTSFAGEIWIEAKTFNLMKIKLSAKNTSKHPFIPVIPSSDEISNVNLDFTYNYKLQNNKSIPNHFQFSYEMMYDSKRDTAIVDTNLYKNTLRNIYTEGMLYFYDYYNPFILPVFNYVENTDDYYKMSFIPYNEIFWKENKALVLTSQQKENLKIIEDNGYLINYREGNYGAEFLKDLPVFNNSPFREFYYVFWSADKRIIPNSSSEQFETYPNDIINAAIKSDLYNLKVQLLLDITKIDHEFICKSYTVFDNYYSYFHLPFDFSANAIFNIFFDICEIERRDMQHTLDSKLYSRNEIQSIYDSALLELDNKTAQFLKEIDLGENEKELKKWNQYVYDNLGIDNIELINNTYKHQQKETGY
ncbi:MAG: carboxypeptidase-like regulatory domain-containing protein [bacterium]